MSYSDLIPMPLQDELIRLRDEMTRNYFRIGDAVQEAIDWNMQNGRLPEIERIQAAVGMFAGKQARTIREYHHIALFFPPELREQFSVLAFDHFRHAARLGDQSILALQWAVEQVDELGRPATVDAMVAKFAAPEPGEPEPPPDLDEGPGGILRLIFRSATSQMMAASNWLECDLPGEVREAVEEYQEAARLVVECLPTEANPSWRGGTG